MQNEIEDTTSEQTKKCETTEERASFVQENGVELSDGQIKDIAGGASTSSSTDGKCPGTGKNHYWYDTGETRPSKFGENNPPDRKMRCKNCGLEVWQRVLFA